ncbi:MAG: tyrosine recombinase XerC [Eubacteriales bacterium]|nr:tyrosine recombinase XerC [Eubacteriales bacterium]
MSAQSREKVSFRKSQGPLPSYFYYLEEFLAYFSGVKERSELTIKEYAYDLSLFFRWYQVYQGRAQADTDFEDIDISTLDLEDLKAIKLSDFYRFMSWLAQERGVGPAGRARKVSSLRAFFNFLTTKIHVLDHNPAAELESPKQMKALPQFLDIEESRALLAAAASSQEAYAARDYCILALLISCGLRLSELCAIDVPDVEGEQLRVLGKGSKERTVYLNHLVREALDQYLPVRLAGKAGHEQALFISRNRQRMSQRAVENVVKKYLQMAGLDSRRYSTHKLRHTAATLMYQYGGADLRSLQQILGHSSVATTEIYTHISDRMLQDTIDQHPLNTYSKEDFTELGQEILDKADRTEP